MKKTIRLILTFVSVVALAMALASCVSSQQGSSSSSASSYSSATVISSSKTGSSNNVSVQKNGTYTDKDHVALYIHTYGTVPSNYISKNKARKAGWINTKGNLWDVLPGMSIGGGGYDNDDNMLPDAPGRQWFECDIDYHGGFRNEKRIVYSNDGLIYYTGNHYKSFQKLY